MNKSTLTSISLAVSVAAGLTACGGGGGAKTFPPSTPQPGIDAFFAAVSGIVSSSTEEGSPNDPVDAIAVTTPEDTEPEPLG
jgi:hypothetical protein